MKMTGLLAMLLLGATVCSAAEPQAAAPATDTGWSFIQICFAPGVPAESATSPTYGVKVGAPISDGAAVCGVEAAVCYADSSEVDGFQGSLVVADCQKVTGLQLSLVNLAKDCFGLQLGIVNYAEGKTCQLGIINIVKDSPLACFPVFNCRF